jgi:hypothetical protein
MRYTMPINHDEVALAEAPPFLWSDYAAGKVNCNIALSASDGERAVALERHAIAQAGCDCRPWRSDLPGYVCRDDVKSAHCDECYLTG